MYHPRREQFREHAQFGNLIPVYREILADLETPVSAFLKIRAGAENACLLESVVGGEHVARFSYLAANPRQVFTSKGRTVTVRHGEGREETRELKPGEDPLHALKELMGGFRFVPIPGWRRFPGGAVGYMAYDVVRFFEELPDENPDDLGLPDCAFMIADTLLVFDHAMNKVMVLTNAHVDGDPEAAYDEAIMRIEALIERLRRPVPAAQTRPRGGELRIESTMTKEQHREAVLAAKEYVNAGDIIQAVLSHRMKTRLSADPFDVYRALRSINPSPYMFYLAFGDLKLIGSSPEILVTEEHGRCRTRPIAGTRRRGRSEEEDRLLEQDLLSDEKERAEHIMLVDLHRNDLGRVCRYGTVEVDELMVVERYSHVMHIVSNVIGELEEGRDQFDLIRAAFPAGTLSGAPKIRAMEIIDELEPVRRGPYGGAVGYFGFSGTMDTCITLRTIVMKGDTAYVQAGGGIVADSDPDAEHDETMMKAGALLDAIRMAEGGLQ